LSERIRPILFERLSHTYISLNQLSKAKEHADLAVAEGERIGLAEFLGYFYGTRAHIAIQEADLDSAVKLYQQAFQAFRDASKQSECARILSNLAQCYFDMKRYRSSRRALAASERLAAHLQQDRTRALVRIKLGEIEELEKKPHEATAHWREAAAIARRLNDKVLRFQAEFLLYRQAVTNGNELTARAIERRLQRTSPWIRGNVEELEAFRRLSSSRTKPLRRRVAARQQAQPLSRNAEGPESVL